MERTALALQRHWREERIRQQDDSVVEVACEQAAARVAEDLKRIENQLTHQLEEECGEMRADLQGRPENAAMEAQILEKVAMQMQDLEAQISQQLGAFQEAPILDKVTLKLQDFETQISAQLASLNPTATQRLTAEMRVMAAESQSMGSSDEQPAQPQPQEEPDDDVIFEISQDELDTAQYREQSAAGAGFAAARGRRSQEQELALLRGRRSREQALALSLDAHLQATAAQLEATDNRLTTIDARVESASNRLQDQAVELKKRADEIRNQTDKVRSAEEKLKGVMDQWENKSKELLERLQGQSEELQSQAESLQAKDSAIHALDNALASHKGILAELRSSAQQLKQDQRLEEATNKSHRSNESMATSQMREEFARKLENMTSTLRLEMKDSTKETKQKLAAVEEKTSQTAVKTSQDINSLKSELINKFGPEMSQMKEEAFNIARSASGVAIGDIETRMSDSLKIAKAQLDQRQAALEAQLNSGLQSVKAEIQKWVSDGFGVSELRQHLNECEASVRDIRLEVANDFTNLKSSLSALRAEALGEIEAERGLHERTSVTLHALRRDFDGVFKPLSEVNDDGTDDQAAAGQSIVQKIAQSFLDWRSEMQDVRSRVDEALKGEEWCVETTQASLFVHQQKVDECVRATSWARREYDSLTKELQEWIQEFRPDQDQIEAKFLERAPVHRSSTLRESLRDVLAELGSWAKVLHMLLKQHAGDLGSPLKLQFQPEDRGQMSRSHGE
jgi:hypothetical protein